MDDKKLSLLDDIYSEFLIRNKIENKMSKLLNFLRSKVDQLTKQKKNQNLILTTMLREML